MQFLTWRTKLLQFSRSDLKSRDFKLLIDPFWRHFTRFTFSVGWSVCRSIQQHNFGHIRRTNICPGTKRAREDNIKKIKSHFILRRFCKIEWEGTKISSKLMKQTFQTLPMQTKDCFTLKSSKVCNGVQKVIPLTCHITTLLLFLLLTAAATIVAELQVY